MLTSAKIFKYALLRKTKKNEYMVKDLINAFLRDFFNFFTLNFLKNNSLVLRGSDIGGLIALSEIPTASPNQLSNE